MQKTKFLAGPVFLCCATPLHAMSLQLGTSPYSTARKESSRYADVSLGAEFPYDVDLRFYFRYEYTRSELKETETQFRRKLSPSRDVYDTSLHMLAIGGRQTVMGWLDVWGGAAAYAWDGKATVEYVYLDDPDFAYSGWGMLSEFGIGTRFQISKNFQLGIDWLSLSHNFIIEIMSEQSYEMKLETGDRYAETNTSVRKQLQKMTEVRVLGFSLLFTM